MIAARRVPRSSGGLSSAAYLGNSGHTTHGTSKSHSATMAEDGILVAVASLMNSGQYAKPITCTAKFNGSTATQASFNTTILSGIYQFVGIYYKEVTAGAYSINMTLSPGAGGVIGAFGLYGKPKDIVPTLGSFGTAGDNTTVSSTVNIANPKSVVVAVGQARNIVSSPIYINPRDGGFALAPFSFNYAGSYKFYDAPNGSTSFSTTGTTIRAAVWA